jgi:Na+/H+ antiporter NhaD/arsenite permease-like protein
MTPVVLLILVAFIGLSRFIFRKDLALTRGRSLDVDALDTSELITNYRLLLKALIVMGGVVLGFLLHGALGLEPATIAMAGATLLMLWAPSDPHEVLRDIEWTTLFFFIGLFITVEAVVEVGIIEAVAREAVALTRGDLVLTSMLLI